MALESLTMILVDGTDQGAGTGENEGIRNWSDKFGRTSDHQRSHDTHGGEIQGKLFRCQKNQGKDKRNRRNANAHAISPLNPFSRKRLSMKKTRSNSKRKYPIDSKIRSAGQKQGRVYILKRAMYSRYNGLEC